MVTLTRARRMDVIDDLTRRRFIGGGLSLAALLTTIPAEPQRVVTVGLSDPLYPSLKVAREGRDVFLTDKVLLGSVIFGSPLSLPYALDRIVPMLAAALDGDPATEPAS